MPRDRSLAVFRAMSAKKVFTACSIVSAGIVVAACSSTSVVRYSEDLDGGATVGGGGAASGKRDGGAGGKIPVTCPLPNGGPGGAVAQSPGGGVAEEGTVGKLCKTDADCDVAGSVGDNVCSNGFFSVGDVYTDPVCVGPCRRGPGETFADILCDGNAAESSPGVCLADQPGEVGPCMPACEFDSTSVITPCAGTNQCGPAHFGTLADGSVVSLGVCLGACRSDADCKGSQGQKCQVETGVCVTSKNHVSYTKDVGEGCNGAAAPDECNCNSVGGSGTGKDRGHCTHACLTGACGDDLCNALATGWRCSAGLPSKLGDGKPGFTGQPDGIAGACALPCTRDQDCASLAAAIGGGVSVKCEDTAGFKICVAK